MKDEDGNYRTFLYATVKGNCCWEVKDRFRGGQSEYLKTTQTHEPGWPIKSVRLNNCSPTN